MSTPFPGDLHASLVLPGAALEQFVDTLQASLRIHTPADFYLWSQGALQRFLPHRTLVCACADMAQGRFRLQRFASDAMAADAERDQMRVLEGLVPRIAQDWQRAGAAPRLFRRSSPGLPERRRLPADFQRHGFGHVLAHGPREIQGPLGSFFVFLDTPQPPCARDACLLELLMPSLHMALYRMVPPGPAAAAPEALAGPLLTPRELQVLRWVRNGKTNEETGRILGLSAPTVKNHVQKILRKLDVSNRAQAVGKAEALQLFTSGACQRAGEAAARPLEGPTRPDPAADPESTAA